MLHQMQNKLAICLWKTRWLVIFCCYCRYIKQFHELFKTWNIQYEMVHFLKRFLYEKYIILIFPNTLLINDVSALSHILSHNSKHFIPLILMLQDNCESLPFCFTFGQMHLLSSCSFIITFQGYIMNINLVYKCPIHTRGGSYVYIWMTADSFKNYFCNHITRFKNLN